jgi:hypothetical protein
LIGLVQQAIKPSRRHQLPLDQQPAV